MPNLAWTWTTLIEALQKWPRNTSTTYIAQLPIIVGLGERRLWRELNLELLDVVDININMTTGTREVDKPADVLQLRTVGFYLPVGEGEEAQPEFRDLEKRSYEFCLLYQRNALTQGVPKYYAELATDQVYVVPTPDLDYLMHYRYIGAPPETLSSSAPNTATWISRTVPDALFSACLMEADHYLKADDRYGDMKSKYYEELLPTARAELRQSIRTGDYAPLKPAAAVAQQ